LRDAGAHHAQVQILQHQTAGCPHRSLQGEFLRHTRGGTEVPEQTLQGVEPLATGGGRFWE